jgi:hypothetical protein
MPKLSTLGQDIGDLIRFSDVVPAPKSLAEDARFTARFSIDNIKQPCNDAPSPHISADHVLVPLVAPALLS